MTAVHAATLFVAGCVFLLVLCVWLDRSLPDAPDEEADDDE